MTLLMYDPPSSPVCSPSVPPWPLRTSCHTKNAPRTTFKVVRAGSTGCIKLLDSCLPALNQSAGMLLDVLLTLAQDDWGQVSGPCQAWLQQAHPSEAGPQVLFVPAAYLRTTGSALPGRLAADHPCCHLQCCFAWPHSLFPLIQWGSNVDPRLDCVACHCRQQLCRLQSCVSSQDWLPASSPAKLRASCTASAWQLQSRRACQRMHMGSMPSASSLSAWPVRVQGSMLCMPVASWVVQSCLQHAALSGLHSICLQACKPSQVTAEVLQNPVQLQAIMLELTQGLAFDPAAAALLLHNTSTGGAHLPRALPATQQESAAAPQAAEAPGCCAPAESSRPEDVLALSAAVAGPLDRQLGTAQEPLLDASLPAQHALSEGLQLPAVMLPRMPGGLKFIATGKAYEAAARVARALGRAAAGSGGPADNGVVQLSCPGLRGLALCLVTNPQSDLQQRLPPPAAAQGDLFAPRLLWCVTSCCRHAHMAAADLPHGFSNVSADRGLPA